MPACETGVTKSFSLAISVVVLSVGGQSCMLAGCVACSYSEYVQVYVHVYSSTPTTCETRRKHRFEAVRWKNID